MDYLVQRHLNELGSEQLEPYRALLLGLNCFPKLDVYDMQITAGLHDKVYKQLQSETDVKKPSLWQLLARCYDAYRQPLDAELCRIHARILALSK
jgi:hypothetical protein